MSGYSCSRPAVSQPSVSSVWLHPSEQLLRTLYLTSIQKAFPTRELGRIPTHVHRLMSACAVGWEMHGPSSSAGMTQTAVGLAAIDDELLVTTGAVLVPRMRVKSD